jgi:hypothetical protein
VVDLLRTSSNPSTTTHTHTHTHTHTPQFSEECTKTELRTSHIWVVIAMLPSSSEVSSIVHNAGVSHFLYFGHLLAHGVTAEGLMSV